MYKPFDKYLYKQYDDMAKKLAVEFFKKEYNLILKENQNKYGVDLIAYTVNNQKHGYVECETKNNWNSDTFPFSSVQFPERKKKFCSLDLPVMFFMTNKQLTKALLVDGVDLISSPLTEVPNKYVKKNENFFQVPLDKVIFVNLTEEI